ncbi:myosin-2 heavy chain-like protein isoform X2 [Wolffia australiana]
MDCDHQVKDDLKMSDSRPNTIKESTTQGRDYPPINWFPREKTDSYLKRKIQHLQEMEGMNSSLDETLNSANPHYTKIAREKIAALQAAKKAMKLRKTAMVEASWCRILHAARINSKEAEQVLEKAEKEMEDAFRAVSSNTVAASVETTFEVDKEVAMAVKKAFIRLAKSSPSDKEEFKDLIHKIRENPEEDEDDEEEAEELSPDLEHGDEVYCDKNMVNLMFDRLKHLSEEEIASLAIIVAAAGLGEALVKTDPATFSSRNRQSKRRRGGEVDFPGLDKFLVKHVSKLEKEVQAAKVLKKTGADVAQQKTKKHESDSENGSNCEDLGSILVRHVSRLEREISSFKDSLKQQRISGLETVEKENVDLNQMKGAKNTASETMTKEDQFVESNAPEPENLNDLSKKSNLGQRIGGATPEIEEETWKKDGNLRAEEDRLVETNSDLSKMSTLSQRVEETSSELEGHTWKKDGNLKADEDRSVELHMSDCEKVKKLSKKSTFGQLIGGTETAGLDQILVKHQSELEKAKLGAKLDKQPCKKDQKLRVDPTLEEVLVKRTPDLDKLAEPQKSTMSVKPSATWRAARDQKLQESWGGLSLENSLKPHLSRLEREKAAWKTAEEEEKRRARV